MGDEIKLRYHQHLGARWKDSVELIAYVEGTGPRYTVECSQWRWQVMVFILRICLHNWLRSCGFNVAMDISFDFISWAFGTNVHQEWGIVRRAVQ